MFDRIATRYDIANRVMSAGIDEWWRRKALKYLAQDLPSQPNYLDLGAGTMDGARAIARTQPSAQVTAADFAVEMLRAGKHKVDATPEMAARTHVVGADAHHLPFHDDSFDRAFSTFCVRNLTDIPQAMGELRRVVRPGGRIAVVEFFRPEKKGGLLHKFLDGFYNRRLLPIIGRALTGDAAAYNYLPDSIARFLSVHEYSAALEAVGFENVEAKPCFQQASPP